MKSKKKSRRWMWVVGIIVVVIAGSFFALRSMADNNAASNAQTTIINRGEIQLISIATGKIESSDEDTIKLSGAVSQLFVSLGDVVAKGDILGEYTKTSAIAQNLYAPKSGVITKVASAIDSSFEIADRNILAMNMPVSEFQINKVVVGQYAEVYIQAIDTTFYGIVKDKATNVNALGQYIINLEFTNSANNVLVGMNAVAKVNIDGSGDVYYHGSMSYGNPRVIDVNGSMLSTDVAVGDSVSSGQLLGSYQARAQEANIVATRDGIVSALPNSLAMEVVLSNKDALQLVVNIAETDIHKIELDQHATIFIESVKQSFEGHVVAISQIGNTNLDYTTYPITIEFDSADAPIFLGMSASASIVVESKSNILLIPYEALISVDTERYVISADWLKSPSRPQSDFYVPVTTGFADVYNIEVIGDNLEGLEIVVPDTNVGFAIFNPRQ